MSKFGLIGNPISHSKSPALFMAAYPGKEHSYSLIQADTITKAMDLFINGEYKGINVTSPYKDDVLKYVTTPDRISSILKSANILIKDNNEIKSYNSDYYGVKNTLEEYISNSNLKGKPLKAMTIGAGGAGKAAALALCDLNMEVYLANRSSAKAEPYANSIGAKYIPLDEIPNVLSSIDIIVYSLSLSIEQLDKTKLGNIVFFEANYANAQYSNCNTAKYISGKYWLYNQAIPAFRLFTGSEPNTLAMSKIMGL